MPKPARRTAGIDVSGIRKVFDLAADLVDPVNFSIGQPDFDVPDVVKDAAVRAIREGFNHYTPTQGIPELREGVRALMKRTRDWEPEEVFITSGVSGGLLLTVLALVDPGDEVVIPDPYFLSYKQLTKLVGATPVFVDTYPDFRLTAERLERAITPRTKLLFVNSPANPTGAVVPASDLREIAEVCRRHDLFVVTDEIYDSFVYEGDYASLTRYLPEAVLLGGFSKSCGMTGWRLGYACGPKAILQQMLKLQQFTYVNAPSPVQQAGLRALEVDTSEHVTQYRRKRDLICDGLKERFELVKPAGAFYVFPKVPRGTDMEFATRAIERGCLVVPGSVFSERSTHVRISYATTDEAIVRGVDILNGLA